MFPFELDEETLGAEDKSETEDIPKEYEINYESGQLTGRIVIGSEAVKAWAWLALQTVRFRFETYTWDYGNEMESLVGGSYSKEYIKSECTRMTKECLSENPAIIDIENLECDQSSDKLTVSFTLITKYGKEELYV